MHERQPGGTDVGATHSIAVNGLQMNVVLDGAGNPGTPVLLVHGFPDDHTVWRELVPALVAAGHRVIAPDMRGCGATDLPPQVADYRIEQLVADLAALLDALGIARVKLVAHDWGAVVGWHFALQHPARVERYVAMSVGHPWCYAHGGIAQKLRGWYTLFFQLRGLAELLLRAGDWWLMRTLLALGEEWPAVRARLERPGRLRAGLNYYIANLGLLLSARPDPVDVPVTGLWSSGDRFLVERQMSASGALVRGRWDYRRIDGANHWLQLDRPDLVNPIVLDALS